MSSPSTPNRWWARLLLSVHLVAVAASIVLFWPTLREGGETRCLSDLGVSAVFIVILFAIGASSARIGGGHVLRTTDWALHGIWTLMMVSSCLQDWGPFAFHLEAVPGSIDSLRSLEARRYLVTAIRLTLAVVLYSGIPLGLGISAAGRPHQTPREGTKLPKMLSIVSFATAALALLLLRYVWHSSEMFAGLVVGVLLVISFSIAGFFAARGDNASTRILLCEAGLFGLLRFV